MSVHTLLGLLLIYRYVQAGMCRQKLTYRYVQAGMCRQKLTYRYVQAGMCSAKFVNISVLSGALK